MSEDQLSLKAREALRHIRNWVMHKGRVPSVRELQESMGYKSPRSTMLLMQELETGSFLKQKNDGTYILVNDLDESENIQTVTIPLVGSIAAGTPLLAEQNIEAMIPVSKELVRSGNKYYLLRVQGDSMDLAGINNGDLILVKQQPYAEDGQKVVALIDDEATVKEFRRTGDFITLLPRSSKSRYQPIIVSSEIKIQGLVVAVIPFVN